MHLHRSLSVVVMLLGAALVSVGQTPTAQVTGAITDSTGATVPGAEVTVINVDTGIERQTTSNNEGYYAVPLLPPGNYSITIRKASFKPIHRSGLTLVVDQVARIDFAMEVGAVTDTVEVTAAAPMVERETAALGTLIDNRKIVNLP